MTTATAPTVKVEPMPMVPFNEAAFLNSVGIRLGEFDAKNDRCVQVLVGRGSLYLHGTVAEFRAFAKHINDVADWIGRKDAAAAALRPSEPDRDEDGDTAAEPTPTEDVEHGDPVGGPLPDPWTPPPLDLYTPKEV